MADADFRLGVEGGAALLVVLAQPVDKVVVFCGVLDGFAAFGSPESGDDDELCLRWRRGIEWWVEKVSYMFGALQPGGLLHKRFGTGSLQWITSCPSPRLSKSGLAASDQTSDEGQ